jgi:hypothetical protein
MALAAIAASTAEPPARSTSAPALEASECGDVTMPRVANVTGRPVLISKMIPDFAWRLSMLAAQLLRTRRIM